MSTPRRTGRASVHSITIDPSYNGSLDLIGGLTVQGGGFDMEGGNIEQPNGSSSDISVIGGRLQLVRRRHQQRNGPVELAAAQPDQPGEDLRAANLQQKFWRQPPRERFRRS